MHQNAWLAIMIPRATLLPFVLASLLLALTPAFAEPSLQVEAGATTLRADDMSSEPGFAFGGSLALARWAPSGRLAFSPQLGILLARRTTGLALGESDRLALAMDSLEIPFLLRGELTLAGRTFYAVGGIYGSVLLGAERMDVDGAVRSAGAGSWDLGLLAGGGFELTGSSWGQLSSRCATSAASGR